MKTRYPNSFMFLCLGSYVHKAISRNKIFRINSRFKILFSDRGIWIMPSKKKWHFYIKINSKFTILFIFKSLNFLSFVWCQGPIINVYITDAKYVKSSFCMLAVFTLFRNLILFLIETSYIIIIFRSQCHPQ